MKDNTKIIQKARQVIDDTAESISEELDELALQEATYALEAASMLSLSDGQSQSQNPAFPSMD